MFKKLSLKLIKNLAKKKETFITYLDLGLVVGSENTKGQ